MHLSRHPEIQQKGSQATAKPSSHLIPVVFRRADQHVTLSGHQIPKGVRVLLLFTLFLFKTELYLFSIIVNDVDSLFYADHNPDKHVNVYNQHHTSPVWTDHQVFNLRGNYGILSLVFLVYSFSFSLFSSFFFLIHLL